MKQFALVCTLMISVTSYVICTSKIIYTGSIKSHVDFFAFETIRVLHTSGGSHELHTVGLFLLHKEHLSITAK